MYLRYVTRIRIAGDISPHGTFTYGDTNILDITLDAGYDGFHYPENNDLSVRIHECPYCNLRMDRDINAARNILKRGLGAARQVRGQRQISEPLLASTYGI